MPINKFGISLGSCGATGSYYEREALVRNHVRPIALCLDGTSYDARSRKIIHVAQPDTDSAAANKRYVDACVASVNKRLQEYEKAMTAFRKDILTLREIIQDMQTRSHKHIVNVKT